MNLDLLTQQPSPIPMHAYAAFGALAIGGLQLLMPKGTLLHRGMGYAWIVAMAAVAISGFFIHQIRMIGPFSPIHLLSIFTLYTLVTALLAARAGNIDKHRKEMRILFFLGLLLAGAFTFFPGRVLHSVLISTA